MKKLQTHNIYKHILFKQKIQNKSKKKTKRGG